MVDICRIENQLRNQSDENIIEQRTKGYAKLKEFINQLDQKCINSNIFLQMTKEYLQLSVEDCTSLFKKLFIQIAQVNLEEHNIFEIECDIPKEREKVIPEKISTEVGIKYYRPQDYKISYIPILDKNHMYIYEDYNRYASKLIKLIEAIYLLQINMMTILYAPDISVRNFYIYNNGFNRKFFASFYVNGRVRKATSDVEVVMNNIEQSQNTKEEVRVLRKKK